jgi:hypothetical protein
MVASVGLKVWETRALGGILCRTTSPSVDILDTAIGFESTRKHQRKDLAEHGEQP